MAHANKRIPNGTDVEPVIQAIAVATIPPVPNRKKPKSADAAPVASLKIGRAAAAECAIKKDTPSVLTIAGSKRANGDEFCEASNISTAPSPISAKPKRRLFKVPHLSDVFATK